jgi:hypothetical protein
MTEFNMSDIDKVKVEAEAGYEEAKADVVTEASHIEAEAATVGKATEAVTKEHLENWGEKFKDWIVAEFKKFKGEL